MKLASLYGSLSCCDALVAMRRRLKYSRPRHQTEIVNGAHPGAGARIAYRPTRAMSEHRCFPKKKRLSTHTVHFKWHHRNLSKMTMSHWKRIMNEDTHLLLMWKEKSLYRCIKLTRRWKMISPVIFAGILPPGAHPDDGAVASLKHTVGYRISTTAKQQRWPGGYRVVITIFQYTSLSLGPITTYRTAFM